MTDDLPQNTVLYWRVQGLASGAPVTVPARRGPSACGPRGSLDVAWGSYFDVNGDARADIALGGLGQAVLVYHGLATGVASSATVTVRAPTGVTGFGFAWPTRATSAATATPTSWWARATPRGRSCSTAGPRGCRRRPTR
ncbi:MAG: hypothetical protein U0325_34775 [Polyangiales bacterium]